ncbi:MAG: hypothetical protein ACD_78C00383G0006 [uncultured bacterium (gcode 4)]|uniref:Uncharacterized protein n=1 Tax=uncultured bacterium (gcode 4) TaxID=1234023 RepID=K1XW68_9BACT|nr:MAG: hypothetical protein ACD_78C00383G0006 [uncultured bacterium (gcode 4)]
MLDFLLSKINDFGLVDKFFSKLYNKQREKEIGNENYKRIELRKNEDETWVCFLPWRVSFKEANKLGFIPKNGRVIVYEGPIGLTNPNPNKAKDLLERLVADLKSLKLPNFSVLALSIGTYPGFYVANSFNVKKLVAVVPGSKLGSCIYGGIATQGVRQRAILFGIKDSKQYDSLIIGTNPIENLNNLPEDIEIHLANQDFFIPTIYGEELIGKLDELNKKYRIFRYDKGHVLTLYQFGRNNTL